MKSNFLGTMHHWATFTELNWAASNAVLSSLYTSMEIAYRVQLCIFLQKQEAREGLVTEMIGVYSSQQHQMCITPPLNFSLTAATSSRCRTAMRIVCSLLSQTFPHHQGLCLRILTTIWRGINWRKKTAMMKTLLGCPSKVWVSVSRWSRLVFWGVIRQR